MLRTSCFFATDRERFVLIDVANTGAGLPDPSWSYFIPFRRAFVHTKAKLINEPPPIGGLNTDRTVVACETAWRTAVHSDEVLQVAVHSTCSVISNGYATASGSAAYYVLLFVGLAPLA